jgi:hypothetical protein
MEMTARMDSATRIPKDRRVVETGNIFPSIVCRRAVTCTLHPRQCAETDRDLRLLDSDPGLVAQNPLTEVAEALTPCRQFTVGELSDHRF